MKKSVFILVICFLSGMVYAFPRNGKKSPTVDNTSIKRSERAENKQIRAFHSEKRYSYLVNGRRAKLLRKKQAKSDNGKGL